MKRPSALLPKATLAILLALSLQPRHGYELMKQVEDDSHGRIIIGPGVLYSTLKQLREDGLIEELDSSSDDDRRRCYKLSSLGWRSLEAEMAYYQSAVQLAQQREEYKEA